MLWSIRLHFRCSLSAYSSSIWLGLLVPLVGVLWLIAGNLGIWFYSVAAYIGELSNDSVCMTLLSDGWVTAVPAHGLFLCSQLCLRHPSAMSGSHELQNQWMFFHLTSIWRISGRRRAQSEQPNFLHASHSTSERCLPELQYSHIRFSFSEACFFIFFIFCFLLLWFLLWGNISFAFLFVSVYRRSKISPGFWV